MHDNERRRRRRSFMLLYPALYGLTFIGIGSAEPRLWGIPLWYLWSGLLILALVPLNLYFVRQLWPEGKREDRADA